jgi:polyvinyl alcohol dehydrogenase (cytochrome)
VVAYDAATGREVWRTYTTDPPKLQGVNASGAQQFGPAGASIWNSPTIDARRGQLYVGTGGNSTSPATGTSDSILALDLATGAVRWVYQAIAGDASNLACLYRDRTNCPKEDGPDYDFGAAAMLVKSPEGRQLLLAGQKSGHVHAIDPDTGKLVWKARPGRGGFLGGVHFGLAANDRAVFVPINDAPDRQHNGQPYPEPGRPGLYALDLATGKTLWSQPSSRAGCAGVERCAIGYSQAITATPELVLAGNSDGWLRLFDADSGELLWRYDTKTPVMTVNGVQASGGSFGGGGGPIAYHGMLFAGSGYAKVGLFAGNVLFAFEIDGARPGSKASKRKTVR